MASDQQSQSFNQSVPSVVTVLPHGWQTNVSRRTGQTYWFNVNSGASVYEEPADLIALRNPVTTDLDPRDPRSYEKANAAVIASNENIPSYREAAEAIISALSGGRDTNPHPGCKGIHRFPPTENRSLRFVIEELAEDYGLKCCLNEKMTRSSSSSASASSTLTADEPRHVVVWREGCDPPEVGLLAAEEKQLNEEAEARRQSELAAARAAVLESKKRLKDSANGHSGDGGGSVVLAGKVAVAATKDDIVDVVPLFAKKDKRSISEITAEIIEKKKSKIEKSSE